MFKGKTKWTVFPRVNYLQLESKAFKDKELKSKADSLSKRSEAQQNGCATGQGSRHLDDGLLVPFTRQFPSPSNSNPPVHRLIIHRLIISKERNSVGPSNRFQMCLCSCAWWEYGDGSWKKWQENYPAKSSQKQRKALGSHLTSDTMVTTTRQEQDI